MKNWMLAILSVALLASCQPKNYQITGTLEGVTAENVILKNLRKGRPVTMDSAKVVDGSFSFTGSVENPEFAILFVEGIQQPITFFIENSKITINGTVDDLANAEITGSSLNDLWVKFNDEIPGKDRMQELQKEYAQVQMSPDQDKQEKMKVLGEEANTIMGEQQAYYNKFLEENTNNAIGAFIALSMGQQMPLEEIKPTFEKLEAAMPTHAYIAELKEVIEAKEKREASLAATKVGAAAPDFTLKTKDGEEVSLSSFKGKYVLVDFWASWCQPCRQENPNVVKAYNKYNSKGFEVFSVSVDDNEEKWLEAVDADGLVWTQVRDAEKEVGRLYAVQSIPTTLLLDKEGVIIAKNLRGAALEEKLAELLN
ncbi:TlpA disulfide reductase family protein [Carboxylicivirga linearis]|uniref:AhpC/TSA family protein n=1 Tax=Carboxylicivirga linearis TaxID=1628157 RepID=A0ABS5JT57_9BACT|nr:TlpA disulfide reductase family protein [Carboxylicivirga linearis]MBS2098003.1 AhpC/TSA family protein [Carboxylicivirga linearis]